MNLETKITLEEAIEWRVPIWKPAVSSALSKGSRKLHRDSKILEIGYNSGKMSCYMASEFGWKIIGYELFDEQQKLAAELSKKLGLQEVTDFRTCPPDKTFEIEGTFDGIFLKSILYHNKNIDDYISWIKWLKTKLNPGGVLMAVENGQGTFLDKFYRKANPKVTWGDNQFFNKKIEEEFGKTFTKVEIEYFGGLGQYFIKSEKLFKTATSLEKMFGLHNANQAFIASIVAYN